MNRFPVAGPPPDAWPPATAAHPPETWPPAASPPPDTWPPETAAPSPDARPVEAAGAPPSDARPVGTADVATRDDARTAGTATSSDAGTADAATSGTVETACAATSGDARTAGTAASGSAGTAGAATSGDARTAGAATSGGRVAGAVASGGAVATMHERLADLRTAFDRSFALPPVEIEDGYVDLLDLRVGGDAYAVRLSEVSALVVDRPPTRLPGAVPELLGVVGVRGSVVPAFDLAALLGGKRSTEPPRWLLVAAGTPALGLAVERLDGHLRVRHDGPAQKSTGFVGDLLPTPAGPRPVIDMAAVRAAVVARVGPGSPDGSA
ncbi:hypothetical protein Val02_20080 [Virgisporangium aliadipatigenens]|uniref:CheW-like domain-containing protein n=1 Tax=Virgisporangium aliadipatigenens TaxID=741659 RepID=A0A8J3YIN2_9ACTN|nr:chemotaxis protein CheW [Virgisporangium aliadipatigenens]GIJ45122.1 hypothetical protein Val02_20080 [Virgisporangium aliadipatigenens]